MRDRVGVGMTLGLAIYLYASRHLPMDRWQERMLIDDEQPLDRDDWRALGALIVLALPVTFFWATYEQQGNTVTLWADGHTDRSLGLFGFTIPTTWFLALNPFLIR